ncbi:MAG: chemotaxis response regulator protein-glutamate methylesterase [Pseudomonadota bacterium]|jgi:two-component system chemotaxis response regulator CheB/two-component system response regulator WspF|uniref:Protein-glutamate methylesterase/protein-glutamine glutaminase n=1 Tax=Caballeronia sordidicola TaxID=196367 RepID=A0A242ML00_CABSO|nr:MULTISPECIES: chemotaxis response regulator protein-glutamate methylesterase [Burkholderiaceae]AMM14029.1 chemotaxis response regulator protein-glutamate methylesterase [Burkholderia sp. PAMC 28687]MDP9157208.1 chemotaxis response regulator protein-glutamate methylesterase [Pseudomonadota bacterium]OTP71831.1 Chemotaxis response regulator protein-glutamate methylesterase CheB [Caballeronia sordidicola]
MKIGIVNDMPLAVEATRLALATRPDFDVIWVATDGVQAVDYCTAQKPDVVLMDLVMPHVDGTEATRRIMRQAPCAILIVTVDVGANSWRVYEAMGAGALDAVDTPALAGPDAKRGIAALIAKIDQVGAQQRAKAAANPLGAAPRITPGTDLLAIGASAGGPGALAVLLAALPADFTPATVIVQHVDQAFAIGMAEWLNAQSKLPVYIAREGDRPEPGKVLLAATNDHLHFGGGNRLGYTKDPEATPYRPSIDVFFNSVVARWSGNAVGVLLTGMGRDGAAGLAAMRANGFYTIAQDEATCAVYGMPKAAAAINAAVSILPLQNIANAAVNAFASSRKRGV